MKAVQILPMVVLGLIVSALVVAAGVKVLANFRSQEVSALTPITVVNESQTISGTDVITPTYADGNVIVSLQQVFVNSSAICNHSLEITVGKDANLSGGYGNPGTIAVAANLTGNETCVSYTYSTFSAVLNSTVDSMNGATEISGQFSTIGIIAVMVIILMMIGGLGAYFALR